MVSGKFSVLPAKAGGARLFENSQKVYMRRLRDNLFVSSWRRIVGLGVLALAVLSAGSVLAQPANDNFTNAPLLDFFTPPLPDSNVGATREPGEPLIVANAGGSSVWYKYIATADSVITVDTIGSDFDTILGVYVGTSVSNLNLVAEEPARFSLTHRPSRHFTSRSMAPTVFRETSC